MSGSNARSLLPLFAALLLLVSPSHADLPEKVAREIEAAKGKLAAVRSAAAEELLKALDRELDLIRRQTALKTEDQRLLLETVRRERAAFQEHGILPCSPRMRSAAVVYLKRLNDARRPLAVALEKAIQTQTKSGDDAGAAAIAAQRQTVLDVRSIGRWEGVGISWTGTVAFVLFDDGTTDAGVWTFEKNGTLTIKKPPEGSSPPEGWIDSCTVDPGGTVITGANQRNDKWRVNLVLPAKAPAAD